MLVKSRNRDCIFYAIQYYEFYFHDNLWNTGLGVPVLATEDSEYSIWAVSRSRSMLKIKKTRFKELYSWSMCYAGWRIWTLKCTLDFFGLQDLDRGDLCELLFRRYIKQHNGSLLFAALLRKMRHWAVYLLVAWCWTAACPLEFSHNYSSR